MGKNYGKVYITGAGCGDYDLITLRGLEAIKKCDVLIYDDLIDEKLLEYVPAGAEIIYMGKRNGRHSFLQQEINETIVKCAKSGKTATFGDSSKLCVGQDVCAIGNPLGDTFSLTLTNGIISAIDRGMTYNGHEMTLLQTNTALNEGNSGGALFNMQGQVVGITNMKMMSYYNSIEGIGFAIPSSTCKAVTDALIADGKVSGRTSIGITVGEIPDEAKEAYNLPSGLYVSDVSKGSDAEKQGIQKGDVITAFDGVECLTTSEVLKIKESLSVGDKMTLTVYRDGESFDVDITLMDTNDLYG